MARTDERNHTKASVTRRFNAQSEHKQGNIRTRAAGTGGTDERWQGRETAQTDPSVLTRIISREHGLGVSERADFISIAVFSQIDANQSKQSTLVAECKDADWANYLTGLTFSYEGMDFVASDVVIPEPTTAVLLVFGATGILARRGRRSRRA